MGFFFFFFLWLKLRPITKMLWKSSKDYIICLYGWYINKAIFLHTSFEEWPRTLLSQPAATGVSNGSMVQIHPPSTIELSKKSFDEWLLCQDLPHHFLGMGGGRGRWSELTCTIVGDEKKSWNVNWNYSYFGQWSCFVCIIKYRSGIYDWEIGA